MKKLLLTLLFTFVGLWLIAQTSPDIEWALTFGGSKGDVANSVIRTADGGFALAGYTNSQGAGSSDFWILKLNQKGNVIWNKTFGGKRYDVAKSIISTADGHYIVVGDTKSKGSGSVDICVMKIDKEGNKVWSNVYGGEKAEFAASFGAAIRAVDGGFVIAGHTRSKGIGNYDYWIFKIDDEGRRVWDKTFGGDDEDFVSSIISTPDGGYAVAGNTRLQSGAFNFWLLKLDKNGNKLWSNVYTDNNIANSIKTTSDRGFIVTGNSYIGKGESNMWVARLDENGGMLWENTYGGIRKNYSNSVINSFDGNFIVSGFTNSIGAGDFDFWAVKLDRLGNMLWEKTFGGQDDDRINCVINVEKDNYLAVGLTKSQGAGMDDVYAVKFTGYLFDLQQCMRNAQLDTLAYMYAPPIEEETTKDYMKRLKEYEDIKAEAIEECKEKYKKESHIKITKSYRYIKGKINDLSYYNTEQGAYKVLLDKWYVLEMPADEAQEFKKNYTSATVEGVERLSANLREKEYINLTITEPVENKVYEVGAVVKAGDDDTYKDFLKKIKADTIEVQKYEVDFDAPDDIAAGPGYIEPTITAEQSWKNEVIKFNAQYGPTVGKCLEEKMAEHKDLIKPKGEFEATYDYEKRVEKYESLKSKALSDCNTAYADMRDDKIKNSYQYVSFKIEKISDYDDTRKEFNILVNGTWYKLIIPQKDAQAFKENWKDFEVKGIKRLKPDLKTYEYINLQVYDSAAGKKYPIGKQVRRQDDKFLDEFYKK